MALIDPLLETQSESTDPARLLRMRALEVRQTATHLALSPTLPAPAIKSGIVLSEPATESEHCWYYCRRMGLGMSLLLHAVAVGLLSVLFVLPERSPVEQPIVVLSPYDRVDEQPLPLEEETQLVTIVVPDGLPLIMSAVEQPAQIPDPPEIAAPLPGDPAPPAVAPLSLHAQLSTISPAELVRSRRTAGGGFAGRTAEARALLVADRGGSQSSEDAVERATDWIVEHQLPDGSWRFDHTQCGCRECLNPGYATTSTGATGLALLPLLARGHTHRSGAYQEVIAGGLDFLCTSVKKTSRGADLQDGTMYGQGIATIALCEAYALSGDPNLKGPAQGAVDFIVNAQHSEGGWRYYPNQAGDTTVLGWQLLALQTARVAELQVPDSTFVKAQAFLDKVAAREGAGFGYQEPGAVPAPTAIGLLSSMYLGLHPDESRLQLGIEQLQAWGPSKSDMYYNYYATQVLHHDNGPAWKTWNEELREHLIDSQSLDGHAQGSWFFADKHAYAGGRLYTTAMCSLILEVYYRHEAMYDAK